MEIITNIREVETKNEYHDSLIGWAVETTENTHYVLVSNELQCCENWGYIACEDDLARFIGSNLYTADSDAAPCDKAYALKGMAEVVDATFVDFKTSAGIFQLVVYNAHNGYYGHQIFYERVPKEIKRS